MKGGARLELRQKQSLVMMPQLQQAIKLLQMSQADLIDFIEKELENNPLLEREESQSNLEENIVADSLGDQPDSINKTLLEKESSEEERSEKLDTHEQTIESAEIEKQNSEKINLASDLKDSHSTRQEEKIGDSETTKTLQENSSSTENTESQPLEELHLGERQAENTAQPELDSDTEGLYDDPYGHASLHESHTASGTQNTNSSENSYNPFENRAAEKTLKQHLTEQAAIVGYDSIDHAIALYLIDQVNENGYLTIDLKEVAEKLGSEQTRIERVLKTLQGFDPTGVMAQSVKECLTLQLVERKQFDNRIQILLENLELLANADFKKLMKLCDVSLEKLKEMVNQVRALSPKPGLAFGSDPSPAIVPDVFIRDHLDGGWRIELNAESLPKLLINMRYYTEVNTKTTQKQEKSFISECHKNATWLMKSLDQRAQTILKVTREIVKQQDAFFAYGITHLKPMTLKDIAEAVEMHESTISRVTANKYLATPRGVLEMKFFFSSALSSGGSTVISAESVRYLIKTLIMKETAVSVLSDDKIVEHLQKTGIEIARRTVAKYRESLKIPSSAERRRRLQKPSWPG